MLDPTPSLAATAPNESASGRFPTIPGLRILKQLGHGGMGIVYEAQQFEPSLIVAVKVMALRVFEWVSSGPHSRE